MEQRLSVVTLGGADLARARGSFTSRTWAWGGSLGHFADPDGHLWEVAWNPHWTLAEDGSIRLPRRY